MDRSATVAGSTFSDNVTSGDSKRKDTFLSRCTEIYESKYWTPPALRAPVLILTIAICWSLIAVLEFLLWKSQRNSGLIFAPVISALPLRDTFLYLYFPTIVAVLFSIYWAWIDLETKRMEPYYQLSKENGALGKDSLLLQYPFSFIPLAPVRALRDQHWPVFWASFAVVLVTWGLVPTQAGIFSIRTVTRTTNMTFAVSTSSMPFEEQATSLTLRYTQSTYGIVSLNETLPPFMSRNYTLAPFGPVHADDSGPEQGIYTAPTTMYTLDLECQDVSHKADASDPVYTSQGGHNFTLGPDGNLTVGDRPYIDAEVYAVKQYTGMYVGFHNGGFADYYLSSAFPKTENTTFFAAIAKSKTRPEDSPQGVTAVFCRPNYWQQEVSATIDRLSKAPLKWIALRDRQPLAWDTFNTTNFEAFMNSGSLGVNVRGDALPISKIPSYMDLVAGSEMSLVSGRGYVVLQPMVGMALGAGDRPLGEYLDWKALGEAYTKAYRLLFARAMVDILGSEVRAQSAKETAGQRQITTEAVVLEPVFVHIVVGFLAVVSVATIALLVLTLMLQRNLRTDPSTIASIMTMVANNQPLLSDFADLDCCTMEDVQNIIGEKRYKLVNDEAGTSLVELVHGHTTGPGDWFVDPRNTRRDSPTTIACPIRPVEFSLWVAFLFVNLFVVLAITLGVLYGKAHVNGLPIPTSNTIVQNILENYIPTAIATLIEPMWILINRLLCLLQPLEELQDCNATADRSIDANYNSLPPQLVLFQALKSKHFVLAAVCAMALLANVLAVSFSGLFNQDLTEIRRPTAFQPPYEFQFVPINGSVVPKQNLGSPSISAYGAYRGGDGLEQFLVAESNYTRNTSLPSWTDDNMFYTPLFSEGINNKEANATHFEGKTSAFGAALDCVQLKRGSKMDFGFQAATWDQADLIETSLNLTIPTDSGNVRCFSGKITVVPGGNNQCVSGPSSVEFVRMLGPRVNATQHETTTCMGSVVLGWLREPQGTCSLGRNITFREESTLLIHCRPHLLAGSARIRVDLNGRLQSPAVIDTLDKNITKNSQNLFSTDPINLVGQSNGYIFQSTDSQYHNDSFDNDFINHFAIKGANSRRLVDPNQPLPTFEEVLGPINKAYSKLFAIWLGINKNNLFVPVPDANVSSIQGLRMDQERRIFLSTTMFIISEAILCTYVFVAIWVYIRRPGQYLARLPTSIASIIALFAASVAVQDMQDTSHLDRKGRARFLKDLDSRYGYGSFIGGGDGRVHIGIEKTPLVVKPRAKSTWLEQRMPLLRKRSIH